MNYLKQELYQLIKRSDSSKAMRMLSAHTDITEQKQKERELERQVLCYNSIIMRSDMGTWEWNVKIEQTTFSKRWANMLGYELSEL